MTENLSTLKGVKIARVATIAFSIDTQLRKQIEMTINSGANVTIISSDPALQKPIKNSKYISLLVPRNIDLIHDFLALIKLFKIFHKEKFDIVHSITPKAGLLCTIAATFARIPIRIHTYTGQPWATLTGFKRFVVSYFEKITATFSTSCYTDSQSQADFLISENVVPKHKISVLGNGSLSGVDIHRFDSTKFSNSKLTQIKRDLHIALSSTVILFIGRIVKEKGVFELLEAFEQISSSNQSLYLLLVGPKGYELTTDELNLLNKYDKNDKIIFLDYTPEPERYMAISNFLCIPSYREGFGTVVIESAAMGLPSIGTKIYGLTDSIIDGETGLLVNARDVKALTKALEKLIHDKDECIRLGNNAKQRVYNFFTHETVNSLVIDEYRKLLRPHQKINGD